MIHKKSRYEKYIVLYMLYRFVLLDMIYIYINGFYIIDPRKEYFEFILVDNI